MSGSVLDFGKDARKAAIAQALDSPIIPVSRDGNTAFESSSRVYRIDHLFFITKQLRQRGAGFEAQYLVVSDGPSGHRRAEFRFLSFVDRTESEGTEIILRD